MEHEQKNNDKDHEQIFSLMLADDYDPSLLTTVRRLYFATAVFTRFLSEIFINFKT